MIFQAEQRFGHRFHVGERMHAGFIELFGDRNPLHTDEQFARARGFAGRVMHGNIMNGFLSHFVGECLPLKNVVIHTQEIRYTSPVYLGDELELEAVVADVHESVGAVEFKFSFRRRADAAVVAKGRIQIGLLP